MATIYNVPKEVKVPNPDFSNYNRAKEIVKEEQFYKELRAFIKPHSKSKYNGKLVNFPVADSTAEYMVVSIKPLKLVHIPLGDAWEFNFINRLTGKDITDKIDGQEAMAKLFNH